MTLVIYRANITGLETSSSHSKINLNAKTIFITTTYQPIQLMPRFTGILGIILILGISFLFSNNKRRINLRLVLTGLGLQVLIALLVFKVPPVNNFFQYLGRGMEKIEGFARQGANFVWGGV